MAGGASARPGGPADVRGRRRARLAAGRCPECGGHRDRPDRKLCAACRRRAAEKTQAYRDRRAAAARPGIVVIPWRYCVAHRGAIKSIIATGARPADTGRAAVSSAARPKPHGTGAGLPGLPAGGGAARRNGTGTNGPGSPRCSVERVMTWAVSTDRRRLGDMLTRADVCHFHADRANAERCGGGARGRPRSGPARETH